MRAATAICAFLAIGPAHAAPLVCEPIPDGAGGGRFLEEVAKVFRGGAIEYLITREDCCAVDWSAEPRVHYIIDPGVTIVPHINTLDGH